MMPIQAKVRHVDQETGQMVEGMYFSLFSTRNPLSRTSTHRAYLFLDWDFVFPDDEREANPTSFKFMQMAHAWKQAQARSGAGGAPPGFAASSAQNDDDDEDDEEESSSEEEQDEKDDKKDDVASSDEEDDD